MSAYYNEIEPFAVAWLRELIKQGHIADGVVDDRSITEVQASDLEGFTQCHFFAGIGVWSYALRQAGWSDDRSVWTGSCPCQPFSTAGKGKGTEDDRHLWPELYRLIAECRPVTVFGEQVANKAGESWFDLVQNDLAGENYTAGLAVFPACGVGAPHQRKRLYWAASALGNSGRWQKRREQTASGENVGKRLPTPSSSSGSMADTNIKQQSYRPSGLGNAQEACHRKTRDERSDGYAVRPDLPADSVADTASDRLPRERKVGEIEEGREQRPVEGRELPEGSEGRGADGGVADSETQRQQDGTEISRVTTKVDGQASVRSGASGECSTGSVADPSSVGRRKDGVHKGRSNEEVSSRVSDGPVCKSAGVYEQPASRPSNGFWGAADWLFCRDGKWRPVESGTFPLANESPARVG